MKVRKLHKHPKVPKTGGGPNFGLRCKEYCPGCVVCEGWRFYDQHGRFPYSYEEIRPIQQEVMRQEIERMRAAGEIE